MALTGKQQRFIEEYLVDCNASAAARRAGYSEKTAFRTGQENMQKPAIKEAIAEAQAKQSERTAVTADWVIEQLKALHKNSSELVDGEMRNPAAANKSLELIGKHLGMYTDKVEQNGTTKIVHETTYEASPPGKSVDLERRH